MRHDFADGKYTVINDNGKLTALRNGEPWARDLIGDNLVYWMLVEVDRLKNELAAAAAPVAPADYLDGINVQRLTDALVWLGVATDAPEFMAARMAEYVNAITSAVIRHKAVFRAAPPSFQARVHPWVLDCFGAEVAADVPTRNYRFLEEAIELVQACGCDEDDAHKLVDYVFGRPVGEPSQEVGGVMTTLAALCLANGLDMHEAADVELARISTPELIAKIRAKQATKPHTSPLPGVSS
jgi:hypothetical protein